MSSLYQQVRKYVDRIAKEPNGPALHAVIDNCGPPYSLRAWHHLRDYADTYPGSQILESGRAVVLPNGHRIKIASLNRPTSLRGCWFASILLTELITQEQRKRLAAAMLHQQAPREVPAPRPVFGL